MNSNSITKKYKVDTSLLLLKNILEMYIYHGDTYIKKFYTKRFINMIKMIEKIIETDQLYKKGYDLDEVNLIGDFKYVKEIK